MTLQHYGDEVGWQHLLIDFGVKICPKVLSYEVSSSQNINPEHTLIFRNWSTSHWDPTHGKSYWVYAQGKKQPPHANFLELHGKQLKKACKSETLTFG